MKINQIVVDAGRTFNHPHEEYSNLKPSVRLIAALDEGEDAEKAVKELQAKAEGLVEDHKQNLLKSIEDLYLLTQRQSELRGLQRQLESAQRRIDQLRHDNPELKALPETTEPEPTQSDEDRMF